MCWDGQWCDPMCLWCSVVEMSECCKDAAAVASSCLVSSDADKYRRAALVEGYELELLVPI